MSQSASPKLCVFFTKPKISKIYNTWVYVNGSDYIKGSATTSKDSAALHLLLISILIVSNENINPHSEGIYSGNVRINAANAITCMI